ncbi:tetratricopeptide repeat protein [Acidihalobacter ferrooxydans]|uniref:tetratricopeptide repeat protein n=1 Tax=Acidihalobacter ferrooxydans TaxID=1765967 RepID=UPI0018DCFC76|nr:tetratricopeptide repeat protein [Acidihalobacter ferrooxydans]
MRPGDAAAQANAKFGSMKFGSMEKTMAIRGGWSGGALILAVLLGGCAMAPAGQHPPVAGADRPQLGAAVPALTPRNQAIYTVLAGELAGQAGDAKQALDFYRKALDAMPEPALAQRVVEVASYLDDTRVAVSAARRWVALDGDNPEAWRVAGVVEARSGDSAHASADLRRFVELNGKPYGHGLVRVSELLQQGVTREVALRVMRELVGDFRHDAYAHYALGVLALHFGDAGQALASAKQALALDAAFQAALILKAQALMETGQTAVALHALQTALRKQPRDQSLQFAYARLLVQAKRYPEARATYTEILRQHPDNPGVLFALGLLDYDLGDKAAARRHLQRFLSGGRHNAAADYFLGRIAQDDGRFSAAVKRYSQVTSGPYAEDAQVRVASILAQHGQLAQARRYLAYLRAQTTDPARKIGLYLVEGDVLTRNGDGAQALALYNEALQRHPGNVRLLYARALLADKRGDLSQAEAGLSRIIQQHPDDAMALNALGYTLAEHTDRYAEALRYIQRALAVRPDDPAILDSMGWVQFRLRHYAAALHYLRAAYAKLPDPEVAAHLVEALNAAGRPAQARQTLRAALAKHPGDARLQKLKQRLDP